MNIDGKRIIVKKKQGADWITIILDLQELSMTGECYTKDSLGWNVKAVVD